MEKVSLILNDGDDVHYYDYRRYISAMTDAEYFVNTLDYVGAEVQYRGNSFYYDKEGWSFSMMAKGDK